MLNVGGQCVSAEKARDWFLCFYLVNSVFIGVSAANLSLSVFWQIGELHVGAALRLNDTLTSLQPRLHSEHASPPPSSSLTSFTAVKTYTLQTIAAEAEACLGKKKTMSVLIFAWVIIAEAGHVIIIDRGIMFRARTQAPLSWVKWNASLAGMAFRSPLLWCGGVLTASAESATCI